MRADASSTIYVCGRGEKKQDRIPFAHQLLVSQNLSVEQCLLWLPSHQFRETTFDWTALKGGAQMLEQDWGLVFLLFFLFLF